VFLLKRRRKRRERARREARRVKREKRRNMNRKPWSHDNSGTYRSMKKKCVRQNKNGTEKNQNNIKSNFFTTNQAVEEPVAGAAQTCRNIPKISGHNFTYNNLLEKTAASHRTICEPASIATKQNLISTEGYTQKKNSSLLIALLGASKERGNQNDNEKAIIESTTAIDSIPAPPIQKRKQRNQKNTDLKSSKSQKKILRKDIGPGWNDGLNAMDSNKGTFDAIKETRAKKQQPRKLRRSKDNLEKKSKSHKHISKNAEIFDLKSNGLTAEKISLLWKEFLETHNYDVDKMPDFYS
jgi:hypothetical protein